LAQDNIVLKAKAEAALFRQQHPEFVPSQRAFELMTGLMQLNDLSPVCQNSEWAWDALLGEGLLRTKSQQDRKGPQTNEGHVYTEAELDNLGADEFARALVCTVAARIASTDR
jgi:hypothetical protein